MFRKFLLIASMLFYVTPLPMVAQVADTLVQDGGGAPVNTDTLPAESDNAGNPLDWGKAELLKWFIPLAGSFLLRQWNKVDGWLKEWNNGAKAAIYTALVTGAMLLGELINFSVSQNTADWGGAFWEGLAASAIGYLIAKIGILTGKEATSPAFASKSRV